jgi:hypothetical protein
MNGRLSTSDVSNYRLFIIVHFSYVRIEVFVVVKIQVEVVWVVTPEDLDFSHSSVLSGEKLNIYYFLCLFQRLVSH